MATASSRMQRRSLDSPDETRPFDKGTGKLDLIVLDDGSSVGRAVFEPGWRWSEHVKPIAKTQSCEAAHVGYVISGRMTVRMDGGDEQQFGPGDVMVVPPGHDAWIDGGEACVVVDWTGFTDYAKR